MYYAGIDIGSTATKLCIFEEDLIKVTYICPTGWSSVKTVEEIFNRFKGMGLDKENCCIVATGYGRVSVPYANKTVTEITCHGKGAYYLLGEDCNVIDIGGQDTKIITVTGGAVTNFTMNDKCAAGTGRFLELMSGTLGIDIEELCKHAQKGGGVSISSMCTVFAESEIISLIGNGTKREDIAFGVIESITSKVKTLCQKHGDFNKYFLTGGLSENSYVIERLSKSLNAKVETNSLAKYAGAIGAALIAKNLFDKR